MWRRSDFHKQLNYVPDGARIVWLGEMDGWMTDELMNGWVDGERLWPPYDFSQKQRLDHMKLKWTLKWLNIKVLNVVLKYRLGLSQALLLWAEIKRCSDFTILANLFSATTAIKQPTNKNYLSCLYLLPDTRTHTHTSKSIYFTVLYPLLLLFLSIWYVSVFLTSLDKSFSPTCFVLEHKHVVTKWGADLHTFRTNPTLPSL